MSYSGYRVPDKQHVHELNVQKSRFIGVIGRVRNRDEFMQLLSECKLRYPRASHYCHAFNTGPPGSSRDIGQSDDGEPHGTAGQPMLNVLLYADVGEVGIVVVRYFGGTKLGKGGLARAYGETAKAVLETASITLAVPMHTVALTLGYAQAARVTDWVNSGDAEILSQDFGASVDLTLRLPADQQQELDTLLIELGMQPTGSAQRVPNEASH